MKLYKSRKNALFLFISLTKYMFSVMVYTNNFWRGYMEIEKYNVKMFEEIKNFDKFTNACYRGLYDGETVK